MTATPAVTAAEMTERPYSFSQVSTYLRCMQSWFLRYFERIERVEVVPRMDLGSAVHAGIAAAWLSSISRADNTYNVEIVNIALEIWGEDKFKGRLESDVSFRDLVTVEDFSDMAIGDEIGATVLQIQANQVAAIIEEARKLIAYHFPALTADWEIARDADGVPLIEYKVEDPSLPFVGIIDAVLRHKQTGGLFIVDYKVRKDIKAHTDAYYHMQLPTYMHLLQRQEMNVLGVALVQLRSRLPVAPKQNKDGSMSRSKSIVTDWPTYRQALLDNGLDPAEYHDMRDALADRTYTDTQLVFLGQETTEAIWNNVGNTLASIKALRRYLTNDTEFGDTLPRNLSNMNCNGCLVREICHGRMAGQPVEHYFESGIFRYRQDQEESANETEDQSKQED